ncbi:prolipoprotein diacylglyceryl transferase, partial [Patescibacteria group bacterium]|nr:prolipoprotein diacylglyceryl transferase [Patescibacteria group bacterium]
SGFLGKRHPTQAYEAIWMFLAYLILLQIYRQKFFVQKRGGRSGATFFSFLVLSGVGRFLIEFYRADTTIINGIRVAHIMSLLVATIGLVGLYWLSNRSWKQDLNLILSFFEKFNWREKFGLSIKVVTKGLNIITEFVGYLATHAASIPLLIKRKSWRKHD